MPDSDTFFVYLALLGPLLGGIVLAYLLSLFNPRFQRGAELLIPVVVAILALAFDLRSEGPAHGLFAYLFISLPGILSFSAWRALLSRRRLTPRR